MKKKIKVIIVLGAVILLLVGISVGIYIYNIESSEEVTYVLDLKVGYYDNSPKTFEDEKGHAKGIFPELLDYIATQEHWNITWIKNDFDACLKSLENRSIDICVDVAYDINRSKYCDFNSLEVLNNWGVIYTRKNANIDTIADLNNTRIAVMESSIHTVGEEGIINLTKRWGIECTFIFYKDYYEVFSSLNNGTSDAGAVNRLFGIYNEKNYEIKRTSIMFNPNKNFFAFPKNATLNPVLISRIDYHLFTLKEDTGSIYYQLLDKYIYQLYGTAVPKWFYPVLIVSLGIIVVFISLSVFLLRMAGKLKYTNKKLKKLDELKSIFVATMNHELRTPLTSIIGFTNMLLKGGAGDINQEQEMELNIIMRNANQLLDLINDILLVNKIETDKTDLEITTFKLSDLMNELKETFSIIVKEKKIDLKIKSIESAEVTNDKKKLRQILLNLINNAINFTDKGVVLIYIDDSEMDYKVVIKDTGIGIKEEDLKKLFKAFSMIPTPDQSKKGTGLGLYISQKLANQLGGKIDVNSEFGKGSTFTLVVKKNIRRFKNYKDTHRRRFALPKYMKILSNELN
jgi:signal transduction histidine kinase